MGNGNYASRAKYYTPVPKYESMYQMNGYDMLPMRTKYSAVNHFRIPGLEK